MDFWTRCGQRARVPRRWPPCARSSNSSEANEISGKVVYGRQECLPHGEMTLQPVLWLAGDWQHADFCDPLAWLESKARCAPLAAAPGASGVDPAIPPR